MPQTGLPRTSRGPTDFSAGIEMSLIRRNQSLRLRRRRNRSRGSMLYQYDKRARHASNSNLLSIDTDPRP